MLVEEDAKLFSLMQAALSRTREFMELEDFNF